MIYTAALAAALAGIVAASPAPAPAPQMLDFGAIAAAPTVATGPTGLAVQQNASVIADVTVTATAAPGATGLSKRNPNFNLLVDAVQAWECLFFHVCKTSAVASTTSTKSTAPVYFTSAVATSTSSSAKLSSYPSSTSAAVSSSQSSSAASSVTVAPVTGTSTTSSSTACPTQPEAGTYCGFINPEDPCAPQPDGYGPVPTPDTVSAFYAYPAFHSMAQSAPTQVPSVNGTAYSKVFQDLNASVSANSYIGLYTLQTYDASLCAAHCDNTTLCTAFNLYVERDPSVAPSTNASTAPTVWGRDCPNPASITNYKCTLYGSSINSTMATNQGQYREQFQIVVTGSDGYVNTGVVPVVSVSTPPATATATSTSSTASSTLVTSAKPTATSSVPVPSWGSAHNCGGKGVNNGQHFMGGRYFPGPFNPQLCADLAWAQNAANKAAAVLAGNHKWTPCTYINAAYYHKDGVPHGTQCNMYDVAVDASFETYVGGFSAGHNFGCAQSFTFQLQVDASFSTC